MDSALQLRRAYERFAAGDPALMAQFLAEDVVYHLPGRHLGGGTLRGRAAVLGRMAQAAAACEAPPRIMLLEVTGSGTFVVSMERLVARRDGRVLDQEVAVVWRVAEEECVEVWSHFADQEACDRFWEGHEPR